MTFPIIGALPEPPRRNEPEGVFVPKANAFLAGFPQMRIDFNAAGEYVENKSSEVGTMWQETELNAQSAALSASSALVNASFKGLWSSLTGAINTPASVLHDGKRWQLLENLANVTLWEPGVSAKWEEIRNKKTEIYSMADLKSYGIGRYDGQQIDLLGFYPDTPGIGGGSLFWDAIRDKADHDGGTVIDPTHSATPGAAAWYTAENTGTGCWVRRAEGVIYASFYGAVGDGLVDDSHAIQSCFNTNKKNSIIIFDKSGTYELGDMPPDKKWKIFIDSPENLTVFANSSQFVTKTDKARDSTIAIKNPKDVNFYGVFFLNRDFNILDTIGGGGLRIGTYGIYLYADSQYSSANPCGGVTITGGAKDCIGFVILSTETELGGVDASLRSIENVNIIGRTERAYYGVSSIYQARKLKIGLRCIDTRRGWISYGQRDAEANISLECRENFVGSNAFVNIACEGDDALLDGNVKNIKLNLTVSGVVSNVGLVGFYHQQPLETGAISNVDCKVSIHSLTLTGQHPSLVGIPQDVYVFYHSDIDGSPISPTQRVFGNFNLAVDVSGNLYGSSVRMNTIPDTVRRLAVNSALLETYDRPTPLQDFFDVVGGSERVTFTPVAFGTTSAGVGTYTQQKGEALFSEGYVHFRIVIGWSSHTGTGPIRVTGLPFISRGLLPQSCNVMGYNNTLIPSRIFGQIPQNLNQVILYVQGETNDIAFLNFVGSSMTLEISGTYRLR